MLKLHVLQAEFGDCLLLEFGTQAQPKHILIDGGPPTTYDRHLRGELTKIRQQGSRLELVVLSHVDNDHVVGLVDMFTELRSQRANGETETIAIGGLWHNSFRRAIDPNGNLENRFRAMMANALGHNAMTMASIATNGIAEGNNLRLAALTLQIQTNTGFPNDLICVDTAGNALNFDNLSLRVVGPTQANLTELQQDWEAWLDANEDAVNSGDPLLMANSDRSIPNLSSIMLLVEAENKKILLTGDGRSDHLLQGLNAVGVTNGNSLHVDVLKLPHHGSSRNITKKFFKSITADKYVASANGKDDNPDLATLIWLVEAAKEQNRSVDIFLTNETPSSTKLLEEYDPADFGYRMTILPKQNHSLVLDLA
jgi:hypothetical protein